MSFVTTAAVPFQPATSPVCAAPPGRTPDAVRGEITVPLDLRHAGRRDVSLRYELAGAAHLPVVLLAGGISAHRHVTANGTFAERGVGRRTRRLRAHAGLAP